MPFMDGIPVTDISSLTSYKINKKQLSEVGVKIFLKQVFEDNFFHADMHPGNILLLKLIHKTHTILQLTMQSVAQ